MRIFDYIEDDEGRKKAVLNKKETAIAQSKQEMIKQEFQDWIWSDPERRERLCKSYNEKFNSVRPREYDGSHIIFNGMNPEIELREHPVSYTHLCEFAEKLELSGSKVEPINQSEPSKNKTRNREKQR